MIYKISNEYGQKRFFRFQTAIKYIEQICQDSKLYVFIPFKGWTVLNHNQKPLFRRGSDFKSREIESRFAENQLLSMEAE
jgi:hypothetical protein